ncbi:MAG: tRNA epoxyqueuosine(34) reductase QueG [Planctomycetales bacterium]|nr:tRNA epoxyqueuosine(34) reductase QueG [Planctomycetales bacterium]
MLLSKSIKSEARQLGFALAGICPAVTPQGIHRFYEWLDAGFAGEMSYLVDRKQAYSHPQFVLPNAKSLVMLALPYANEASESAEPGQGRVSNYAWSEVDYHDVIHPRLKHLVRFIESHSPGHEARGVVDSAPLLEREFAQLAGLGWAGKNTLLLNTNFGSYFFLAAVLTTVELDYDEPFTANHCGTCTACLDACPTDAFVQPYVLDATKCISYLTIELRSAIPDSIRHDIGDWVFGCDVCQEVCPWNSKLPRDSEHIFRPFQNRNPMELASLLDASETDFRTLFRKTPLWRSRRRGILRNALIVLGNQRYSPALAAVERLLEDDEPLVRHAAEWARQQLANYSH